MWRRLLTKALVIVVATQATSSMVQAGTIDNENSQAVSRDISIAVLGAGLGMVGVGALLSNAGLVAHEDEYGGHQAFDGDKLIFSGAIVAALGTFLLAVHQPGGPKQHENQARVDPRRVNLPAEIVTFIDGGVGLGVRTTF